MGKRVNIFVLELNDTIHNVELLENGNAIICPCCFNRQYGEKFFVCSDCDMVHVVNSNIIIETTVTEDDYLVFLPHQFKISPNPLLN